MATSIEAEPPGSSVQPATGGSERAGAGGLSILDDGAQLRRVLVAKLVAAGTSARDAAEAVDRGVSDAVHDFRKAVRRARAVFTLVADALPRNEARGARRTFRDARRVFGEARDHAVALTILAELSLDETERDTARRGLEAAAVPATDEIKQALTEHAAHVVAQIEAIDAALPPTITWSVVMAGVGTVYRNARRARKAAKGSRRKFHTWRRRCKELTYQLEALALGPGPEVGELLHEIAAVADTQGHAVDLIMLGDLVRTHGAELALGAELDSSIIESRRAGRDAFRAKPAKFIRRLTKAMRRDLASTPRGG